MFVSKMYCQPINTCKTKWFADYIKSPNSLLFCPRVKVDKDSYQFWRTGCTQRKTVLPKSIMIFSMLRIIDKNEGIKVLCFVTNFIELSKFERKNLRTLQVTFDFVQNMDHSYLNKNIRVRFASQNFCIRVGMHCSIEFAHVCMK